LLTSRGSARYSRDCAYYLAQCLYREGKYAAAREYCEDLYRANPDNPQIMMLHRAITQRHKAEEARSAQTRDELLVAGTVGAAVLGLGMLLFGGGKRGNK